MSEPRTIGIANVPIIKVLEPRAQIDNKKEYMVLEGIQDVIWAPTPATGVSSGPIPNSIVFNCPPPSPYNIVSRIVYLQMPIRLTITGTNTTNPLILWGAADGFRNMPLQQIITNIDLKVNGTSVTIPTNRLNNALSWLTMYGENADLKYSLSPCMLDQFQNYNDFTQLAQNGGASGGSARNVLGNYGESQFNAPRGGFPVTILGAGTGTMTVDAVLTEPLFISPLLAIDDGPGLIGVQNMYVTLSIGNVARMYAHNATLNPNAISSVTALLTGMPQLLFQYLTPNELVAPFYKNVPYVYPYFEIIPYITSFATDLAPLASKTVTANNIQLSTIPKCVMIWVQQNYNDLSYSLPDVFHGITNLQVQFEGKSAAFTSATQQDLFRMSCKNGYKGSWVQFSKYTGSVIIINLGSDLGLYPNEAPGLGGTYQLRVTVTATNLNPSVTLSSELYVAAISEGAYSVFQNRVVAEVGIFSKNDIMYAKLDKSLNYNNFKKMAPYGGDFFGFLKSLAGPAIGMLPGGPILRSLTGLGVSGGKKKKMSKSRLMKHLGMGVSGGAKKKKKRGGAFLENEDLLERLESESDVE